MKYTLLVAPALGIGLALSFLNGCQPKLPNQQSPTQQSTQGEVKQIAASSHVATSGSPHGLAYAVGRVFVCNVATDSLTVINAQTGAKEANLTVQKGPAYAKTSHGGTLVYALNGASNSVSVIDAANRTVIRHIEVGAGPDKIELTPDDQMAYVSLTKENAIAKVNLTADPPAVTKIPVGKPGSHRFLMVLDDVVISPNSDENSVAIIDRVSDAVTSVSVGIKPNAMAMATYDDGGTTRRLLVVGNSGSNTISIIDLASKQVIKTLDVGISPSDAVVVGTKVYLTNSGSNTVSVIDVPKQQVITTLPVGSKPVHLFVAPAGGGGPASQVWVANDGESYVSVIDTATNTVYAAVETQAGHHKMAFTPDGTMAFVTNIASNSVSVIDRTKF